MTGLSRAALCVALWAGVPSGLLLAAAAAPAQPPAAPPPAAPPATYAVGQKVEVREGDVWSPASVVKQEGRRFQVHYDGSAASADEWVAGDRLRLPGAGAATAPAKAVARFAAGEKVEFKSGPFWHNTTVVNKRGSWYLVQENPPRGDKEWVEHWRLRKPGSKEDAIGRADSWGKVKNGEGPPRDDAGDPPGPNETTRDVLKRSATAALEAKNPATPAVRTAVREVAVDGSANAPLTPDADVAARPLTAKPIVLSGAAGVFAEHVHDLFFSSAAAGVALAAHQADDNVRLDRVDLVGGRTINVLPMPAGRTCADLSPDGKLLLTLTKPDGLALPDRVDVWNIEGPAAKFVVGFRPYEATGKDQPGVAWARFVGSDRVATLGRTGELVVWDLKANAVWATGVEPFGQSVAVSANGKHLAFFAGRDVPVLDAKTGNTVRVLHELPKARKISGLCFKPDGTQLAVVSQDLLFVYDLATGALKHELYPALPEPALQQADRAVRFLGDGYLLTHGSWLGGEQNVVGLEQRMAVWQLVPGKFRRGKNGAAFAGRFWYTFPPANERGKPVLLNAVLPDKDMSAALAKLNLNAEMAVHPGMAVSLEVNLPDQTREKVKAHLAGELQKNGVTVADGQPIKLVATAEQGKAREISYVPSMFGLPGNAKNATKVNTNDLVYRLAFVDPGGKRLWEHTATHMPPGSLQLKKDQSIEDAVREAMIPKENFYASLLVPKLVPKAGSGGGFGQSELTAQGLVPVTK